MLTLTMVPMTSTGTKATLLCTVRAYPYYVEMIDQNQRHIQNLRAKLHTNVSFRGGMMKKKCLLKLGSTLTLIQLWTFVRFTT